MLPVYLYILLINACFFCVDILVRKESIVGNALEFISKRSLLTSLLTGIWLFTRPIDLMAISPTTYFQILGVAIVLSLGLIFFVISFKYVAYTNVAMISLFGVLFQQVFIVLLYGNKFTLVSFVCLLIAIIGIAIQIVHPKLSKGIFYALGSALFFNLGYVLLAHPMQASPSELSTFIIEVVILVIATLFYWSTAKTITVHHFAKMNFKLVVIAVFTTLGVLVVGYTYKFYDIRQVTLYNLFLQPTSVLFAYFILKDKLSKREWIGNAIILIAFIIFQLAQ
jgi:drug/metabolite transporter (DMT)-like permease